MASEGLDNQAKVFIYQSALKLAVSVPVEVLLFYCHNPAVDAETYKELIRLVYGRNPSY